MLQSRLILGFPEALFCHGLRDKLRPEIGFAGGPKLWSRLFSPDNVKVALSVNCWRHEPTMMLLC
jgi:hypothetical protein